MFYLPLEPRKVRPSCDTAKSLKDAECVMSYISKVSQTADTSVRKATTVCSDKPPLAQFSVRLAPKHNKSTSVRMLQSETYRHMKPLGEPALKNNTYVHSFKDHAEPQPFRTDDESVLFKKHASKPLVTGCDATRQSIQKATEQESTSSLLFMNQLHEVIYKATNSNETIEKKLSRNAQIGHSQTAPQRKFKLSKQMQRSVDSLSKPRTPSKNQYGATTPLKYSKKSLNSSINVCDSCMNTYDDKRNSIKNSSMKTPLQNRARKSAMMSSIESKKSKRGSPIKKSRSVSHSKKDSKKISTNFSNDRRFIIVNHDEYQEYVNRRKYSAGIGQFIQVSNNLSHKKQLIHDDEDGPWAARKKRIAQRQKHKQLQEKALQTQHELSKMKPITILENDSQRKTHVRQRTTSKSTSPNPSKSKRQVQKIIKQNEKYILNYTHTNESDRSPLLNLSIDQITVNDKETKQTLGESSTVLDKTSVGDNYVYDDQSSKIQSSSYKLLDKEFSQTDMCAALLAYNGYSRTKQKKFLKSEDKNSYSTSNLLKKQKDSGRYVTFGNPAKAPSQRYYNTSGFAPNKPLYTQTATSFQNYRQSHVSRINSAVLAESRPLPIRKNKRIRKNAVSVLIGSNKKNTNGSFIMNKKPSQQYEDEVTFDWDDEQARSSVTEVGLRSEVPRLVSLNARPNKDLKLTKKLI